MKVEQWLGKDNTLGIDIWERKYRYNNESFDEWLDRVSGGDAKLRQIISERKFLFGGRALANRGTNKKGSMFNCYSSGYAPDNIEGIMQLNTNLALTYKAQGGQGVSLSKIRPKGTPIGNEFKSDGIVPFMEIFNATTSSISQGGARKGALMISLDIMHKEAETFITIKSNEDKITKANLSLEIDDRFMEAVQKYYDCGETITIHEHREYNGHPIEYDVVPIKLYKLMVKTVYDWGEPGCIFTNRFRNYNLMEFDDDYQIETCNPCGEQPLKKNACCNLGSLNLSEFVENPYTKKAEFNWNSFREAIKIAVEALDNIIDENLNNHALKEQAENSKNYRNIGLGIMGYANALFKLGITYGSKQAIYFTEELFSELLLNALKRSLSLAKEKGAFPKCKPEKIVDSSIVQNLYYEGILDEDDFDELKKYGLRNCSLISIAPTGSIATMVGVSGGCEPEFALSYKRRTDNLKESYDVFCKSVNEYWEMTDDIVDKGNIDSLPKYFVTSADVYWKNRIDTQSVMQDYVDTAISSTINLHQNIDIKEVEQIYLYAWRRGLKGVTIYRSGCAREGILIAEPKDKKDTNDKTKPTTNNKLNRGDIICVDDDLVGAKRKLISGCGSLHFEVYFDELTAEPMETFINIGSGGTCERNMQLISRLISTGLRSGVPVEYIIDQCKSIKPCPAYVARTNKYGDTSKGSSCPSAIGFALEELCQKMKELYGDNTDDIYNVITTSVSAEPKHETRPKEEEYHECPECGEKTLKFESGCQCCINCGYSKCD